MRTSKPKTPLIALLRELTKEQRTQLAVDAGTTVTYLYSLGSCSRKACRSDLASRIAEASEKMAKRTKGKTKPIDVATLGTMCRCVE